MNQGSNAPFPAGNTPNRGCARIVAAALVFTVFYFLGGFAGGLVSQNLPRRYYSRVVMELKPDAGLHGSDASEPFRSFRDPNLQTSQIRILQSKEVLYPVIRDLKLAETWASQDGQDAPLPRQEAYERLLTMVRFEPLRNTDLVEIGVFSKDRIEAANVANMTAIAYQRLLYTEQKNRGEARLELLRKEVEAAATKSKAELEAAETQLATQKVQLKLIDSPARIWEKAEPALQPAAPIRATLGALNLGGALGTGFAAAVLFLFFTRARVQPESLTPPRN